LSTLDQKTDIHNQLKAAFVNPGKKNCEKGYNKQSAGKIYFILGSPSFLEDNLIGGCLLAIFIVSKCQPFFITVHQK
jgi:hypothetical protein